MTKSALQIARAAYQPKLPKALKGAVKVKEGEPTQSVADQEAIKALFPNTLRHALIQFVEGEAVNMPAIKRRCHLVWVDRLPADTMLFPVCSTVSKH